MNLVYRSSKGCPVLTKGKVTDFVEQYKIPIGATMILLGIFLCFFGNHFLKAVIFTVSAIVISFGTAYAAFTISEHLTKNQT